MQISNNIRILVKPDYISWDDIHDCLWASHEVNRAKAVIMKYPSLPGGDIKKKIENGNGKMFVAIDGGKVVGVAGYQVMSSNFWFCKTNYLYLCFAGVRPEYSGRGIYKSLYKYIERERNKLGLPLLVFDTHEKNKRMIDINIHYGFVKVGYKYCGDHNNVVMAKWAHDCPHSKFKCNAMFLYSKLKVKVKSFIRSNHMSSM